MGESLDELSNFGAEVGRTPLVVLERTVRRMELDSLVAALAVPSCSEVDHSVQLVHTEMDEAVVASDDNVGEVLGKDRAELHHSMMAEEVQMVHRLGALFALHAWHDVEGTVAELHGEDTMGNCHACRTVEETGVKRARNWRLYFFLRATSPEACSKQHRI